MKNLLMVFILIAFVACKKDKVEPEPEKTSVLKVTAFNSSATSKVFIVSVYKAHSDWANDANAIGSGETNEEGVITFSNLEAINYYLYAVNKADNKYFTFEPVDTGNLSKNSTTAFDVYVAYHP